MKICVSCGQEFKQRHWGTKHCVNCCNYGTRVGVEKEEKDGAFYYQKWLGLITFVRENHPVVMEEYMMKLIKGELGDGKD